MATRKLSSVLAASILVSFCVTYQARAQETTTTTKKTDKTRTAEGQPSGQKTDEVKGKDRGDQAKGKDKCKVPKYESREIEKKTKWGYVCSAADTCDKACNLWRKDKETNDAEFVAKQDEWTEATDGQRRKYSYFCKCEDAK